MSEAGMLAVSCVELTKVVVRAAPFHSTVAPVTKFVPLAVSVKAGPPAVAELGVRPVRVAGAVRLMLPKYSAKNWPAGQPAPDGVTSKFTMLERWPSGFTTNTGIAPAALRSSLVTTAVRRVALTNVVASAWPFQNTVDPDTKPVPSTVSVKPGPPCAAVFGVSVVIAGGGVPPL